MTKASYTAPQNKNSGFLAAFYAASFSALLSIGWVFVRNLSSSIHPLEITFWASVFGSLTFLPKILKTGSSIWYTNNLSLHFARALANGVAILAWFWALTLIPLADAAALNLVAPLLVTLGAIFFFHEKVGPRRWLALIFGGGGALILVRPGFQDMNLGIALAWITVIFSAIQRLLSKSLIKTDSSSTCVVYLMIFMIPVTLVPAVLVWTTPQPIDFIFLAAIGILLSTAHFTWMKALTLADISALEPINFTRLIWGSILGYMFFLEVPTLWTWLGGLMIALSTTYIARRDASVRTDRLESPKDKITN